MKKYLIILLASLLVACGTQGSTTMMGGEGSGMMGGGNSGMMMRHHVQVPAEYAGKTAPVATDEVLADGAEIYTTNCATCHGETGLGDGPAGAALDPAPAQIAHTTQMLADDLVFYRVSEGGTPFGTAMPAWKDVLTEQQIWDVIAYVRAMGQGNMAQVNQMQAAQQDAMLADAVNQGAITQEQADVFRLVHTELENYMLTDTSQGNTSERESAALAALVEAGTVTQQQVDEFQSVHDILSNGGFMP